MLCFTASKGHVLITLSMKIFMHSVDHGRGKKPLIKDHGHHSLVCFPVNITVQALVNIKTCRILQSETRRILQVIFSGIS